MLILTFTIKLSIVRLYQDAGIARAYPCWTKQKMLANDCWSIKLSITTLDGSAVTMKPLRPRIIMLFQDAVIARAYPCWTRNKVLANDNRLSLMTTDKIFITLTIGDAVVASSTRISLYRICNQVTWTLVRCTVL
jgi:hypothetical protein